MDEAIVVERRRLLDEGNQVRAEAAALEDAGEHQTARPLWRTLQTLAGRYRDWLPEVVVARCPFSGEVVRWPIDIVDLDGWFWDSDAPIHRLPRVPARWLMMTGAMRLVQPVTYTEFYCEPGPGAPFVVPRVLNEPGVVAVISELRVGRHTGWPLTYFGPTPSHAELEGLWGSHRYLVVDDDGAYRGWGETPPWPPDYDFDLAPWLSSEKLLWIAPEDEAATLQQGTDGCPYLGIEGPHGIAFVHEGKVRYWSPRPGGDNPRRSARLQ